MPEAARDAEAELHTQMAEFWDDPLGFVEFAYPWPINGEPGPDDWQRENLIWIGQQVHARAFDGVHPVAPIRDIVSSGHGTGKTAEFGWIVDWLMSTRRNMRGTVTANTNDQLDKKTWAGIREWTKRCITKHWFEINSQIMFRKGFRESWFIAPASCAEENSEAFAGQHAKDSTSAYLVDEGSAVPDKIWEVMEGGLTDGEPMIFARGNPTRNTGAFHRNAFGSGRDRWHVTVLDARTTRFANKQLIQEWQDDYGEDSDFFRVRVRGLPPNADELQYIDGARVGAAGINPAHVIAGEPLIAGVDVSGGGSAWTVCRFRRGFDSRSIPPIRLTGEQTVANDRALVVAKLVDALQTHRPDAMFIDSAFGAVIVSRLRTMGYENVFEVNFGGPSADPHDANMRATMWRSLKEWLPHGAIDQHDHRLATDLTAPGFHLNKKNQLVLEAKESMQKRGVASPDDGDALALTWGGRVQIRSTARGGQWLAQPNVWVG